MNTTDGNTNGEEDGDMDPKVKYDIIHLEEGEMLYIPPFTSIRMEMLNHYSSKHDGVSKKTRDATELFQVNLEIKSVSLEQLILLEALHLPYPPFLFHVDGSKRNNEDLNTIERMVCSQVYVMHILSRIKGMKSPKLFMTSLLREKYTKDTIFQFPSSILSREQRKQYDCLQRDIIKHEEIIKL